MVTFLITIFGDSITEYPIFKTKSHDPGSLLCPYSANIVVTSLIFRRNSLAHWVRQTTSHFLKQ